MAETNPIVAGARFDRLLVLSDAGPKAVSVRCDCGVTTTILRKNLRRGTRSCGCLQRETARTGHTKHGGKGSDVYGIWKGMIQRCTNPARNRYAVYGGRGISVCARWRESFEAFRDDMGPRPAGASLDRIDNNGNYEPANVRWSSARTQAWNRSDNRVIEHDGISLCLKEWSVKLGVPYKLLHARLTDGWTFARAIATPVDKSKRGH